MKYEVTGIDISRRQEQIDWQKALAQGTGFVFVRASEGIQGEDPCFKRSMDAAGRLGIARGISHYFRTNQDWRKQAELFAGLIKENQFELEAVVNLESRSGIGRPEFRELQEKFILETEQAAGRELMLHASAATLDNLPGEMRTALERRLWIANWSRAGSPVLPKEWQARGRDWTFWQYSSRRNQRGSDYGAASRWIGLNRYNGSREQFVTAYGLDARHDEPAGPPPLPAPCFRVTCDALHLFNAPRLDAEILGDLRRGEVVQVVDLGGREEVWVQIVDGGWCLFAYNGQPLMQRERDQS